MREEFGFTKENKNFYYNYPIKLNMKEQIQLLLELEVKDFINLEYSSANQSIKSDGLSEKKSDLSSIGKKNTLDLGFDNKISAVLDLTFKENIKAYKKLSLVTPYKNTQREIGFIEFQI